MNVKAALRGGSKLHALVAALVIIEESELEALIAYTANNGEMPDNLSHETAKAFKAFKAEIERITKECPKQQTTRTAPLVTPRSNGGQQRRC